MSKATTKPKTCNVARWTPTGRQLWSFAIQSGKPVLQSTPPMDAKSRWPERVVAIDWHTLYAPKSNVAWLGAEQVFLRVIQLPTTDPAEIAGMLEFQIEKLAPVPLANLVTSHVICPAPANAKQTTVLVVMAERDEAETWVNRLEAEGFQADRLEVPQIEQLLGHWPDQDGVWLYPNPDPINLFAMVAWVAHGTLQHLQMVSLPAGENREAKLREYLSKVIWAGEIEGWLDGELSWHIVGEDSVTAVWQSLIAPWADAPINARPAYTVDQLALQSAAKAAAGGNAVNLLPGEYSVRHRQEFVDRLWMKGLGAVVALYILMVIGYFGLLQIYMVKQTRVENHVASLKTSYTNALLLKERVQILQDQYNLKYASLDALKITSELLPEGMTLTSLRFSKGQSVDLVGTVPQESSVKVTDYNEALRNATAGDQPIFSKVNPPELTARPGSPQNGWRFNLELNRVEAQ